MTGPAIEPTPEPTPGPTPEPAGGPTGGPAAVPPPSRVRRPRAPRTLATALVVVAVVVVGGALLYDVIAVRTGHSARPWRAHLADELATRHLDDVRVLLGAGVAVLLGGWLCWLAFAPGLRRWLPLLPAARTDAVIDRAGVGALLVTRADEVPGVEGTTVRINRRRVRVAIAGPADPAAVQRSLAAELDRIGLARPLRLDVRTRPAKP